MKHKTVPFLAFFMFLFNDQDIRAQNTFPVIRPEEVTIARDSFGIPHIFGKTDAHVAYGLAWANAEDAFRITQELIYTAKGYMGRFEGIKGAKTDFFVHAIGVKKIVEEKYGSDLSPEFRKYLDGFVQGLNAYAAAHPDEVVVKAAFPVTSKDILQAYVAIMSALSGTPDNVGDAVGGKYDNLTVAIPSHQMSDVGSNAFALNSTKTVDGKTYLCINPHMGMEGLLSFYEAHLHSEEGLNMEGCMFQGSSSLAMGVNENLGWGMTWNTFDKVDVFKLNMHPSKKRHYEFDGTWRKLEVRPVWLKVNISKKGRFVLPVKKRTYWSAYGATVKSDKSENYYAVRFPANTTIRTAEQLYKMNKSRNYNEFWEAIRTHALTLFNIVYADKENNIFYIHHGMMPERDTSTDWSGLVAGNSSKTLWTKLVPLDSMPKTINPECGYVFNTNNTPFYASSPECNENGYCYVPRRLMDERPGNNNRAVRFEEQIKARDKHSFQDIHDMKFDVTISGNGTFAESIKPLLRLSPEKYPSLSEALTILNSWNRKAEAEEAGPTILGLTLKQIFDKYRYGDGNFVMGFPASESDWAEALHNTCDSLRTHFGTVNVPWGKVNRLKRGEKEIPLRGFPDVLSPCYPKPIKGRLAFKAGHGDTYTMFAAFGKSGVAELRALQPIGNSLNPQSPHYTDQMELFARQKMRILSLNKEEVLKNAESIYHPK